MIKYEYHESIIYWVITTAHALERAVNEELSPLGMTFRQAEVLAWLALEKSLSQAALAERMRIEAPTLAGIVERMERDGWIAREPCKRDRRKKLLRVTDQVEPIWEQVMQAGGRIRAKAGEGFDLEELQSLIRCLETIQRNLTASDKPKPTAASSGDRDGEAAKGS